MQIIGSVDFFGNLTIPLVIFIGIWVPVFYFSAKRKHNSRAKL